MFCFSSVQKLNSLVGLVEFELSMCSCLCLCNRNFNGYADTFLFSAFGSLMSEIEFGLFSSIWSSGWVDA